jgi:hypothetical protein
MVKKKWCLTFDTFEQFIEMRFGVTSTLLLDTISKDWDTIIQKDLFMEEIINHWENEKKRIHKEVIEEWGNNVETEKQGN